MRFFDGRIFRLLIFPVLFVCSVLWVPHCVQVTGLAISDYRCRALLLAAKEVCDLDGSASVVVFRWSFFFTDRYHI